MTPYPPQSAPETVQAPLLPSTLSRPHVAPDAPAQDPRPRAPDARAPGEDRSPGVPVSLPARIAWPPGRPHVAPLGAGGHAGGPAHGSSPQSAR